MYSRMAKMAGEAVVFECNHNCTHMSFLFAKWYKNDIPLNLPQTRYLLTSNGVILILKQVTPADSGEYKCEGHVGHGQTIYERYVSLTVKGKQCKDLRNFCWLIVFVSCSFGLWDLEEFHEKV